MEVITYVVEFDGEAPPVNATDEINGGKLIAAYFGNALEELMGEDDDE